MELDSFDFNEESIDALRPNYRTLTDRQDKMIMRKIEMAEKEIMQKMRRVQMLKMQLSQAEEELRRAQIQAVQMKARTATMGMGSMCKNKKMGRSKYLNQPMFS